MRLTDNMDKARAAYEERQRMYQAGETSASDVLTYARRFYSEATSAFGGSGADILQETMIRPLEKLAREERGA